MSIQIISYSCKLKNRMGHVISYSIVRDVMIDPEDEKTPLKALSTKLRGIKKGETREIFLHAHEAYGLYDPKLVLTRTFDGDDIGTPLKLNEQVIVLQDGKHIPMRVIEFSSDAVTLDGNHPLAGQDLIFEIEALDTREATEDELKPTFNSKMTFH